MARNIDEVIAEIYGSSFTGVDDVPSASVLTAEMFYTAAKTLKSHGTITPVIIDDPFNQHPYGISGLLGSLSKPQEDEDVIPF